jgi:6-pyruvoyltetrahydropterin/6-carboxytetrahydropterin synthase
MFEITVEETFSSGHALREYRGKCENPHGHNYKVQVTLQGPQLNRIGLLADFKDLKRMIRTVTDRIDHHFLNDLEPFTTINPSAENLAKYFYDCIREQLAGHAEGVAITSVKLWETDTTYAKYWE